MRHFIAVLFTSVLLVPSLALAKRAAPADVTPVIYQGIRYTAPNDGGRRAYIEAWDIQTNKRLWDLTVFTNHIDPKLEEDVQWVFIKSLKIRDGALVVTSERGKSYRVDLKTKLVTQSVWPNKSPEPIAPSSVAELLRRTGVGPACGTVHAASRRWLSSGR